MSYTFSNRPFFWNKSGVDATADEANLGLQGGMALPAPFINQQWMKTYKAIEEIQRIIENETIGGRSDDIVAGNGITVGQSHTTNATKNYAVFGVNNTSANGAFVCGKSCKTPTATSPTVNTGDLFVIGSGIEGGAKSNALRVTAASEVMGTTAYAATGADYAECFEWLDGNPNNEDRRGLFVTLEGEKIRLATADDDYILGVISATPSVIGDACTDDWHGKYVTDVFGARVMENEAFKLSDDFDIEQDENYISRLERPEWATVGLIGKLIVIDDGSCEVNGYCYPSENGIATKADKGYRVMSRIDENHVKIMLK
jgi:hypothetical protein